MGKRVGVAKTICSTIPEGYKTSVVGSVVEGPEVAKEFFEAWQKEVIATVPKERLLIFQVINLCLTIQNLMD